MGHISETVGPIVLKMEISALSTTINLYIKFQQNWCGCFFFHPLSDLTWNDPVSLLFAYALLFGSPTSNTLSMSNLFMFLRSVGSVLCMLKETKTIGIGG